MRCGVLLLAAALLAGCDGAQAPRVILEPCTAVEPREYSQSDQLLAAQTLRSLQEDHPLRAMVEELGGFRAAARATRRCFGTAPALPHARAPPAGA